MIAVIGDIENQNNLSFDALKEEYVVDDLAEMIATYNYTTALLKRLTPRQFQVIKTISLNPYITLKGAGVELGVSKQAIAKHLKNIDMKRRGVVDKLTLV